MTVQPAGEDWPGLRLEYVSSPGRPGDEQRVTRLVFGRVVQYAWGQFEFPLSLGNPQDSGFHLIEITDSELVRRIVEEGHFSHYPPGQRAGASVPEDELRHYRLGFDEHGYYDVVCADLEITHTTTSDISPYPG
ncbi:hypothetical protein E1287_13700 [Actinomadura sp. KC06]|uniref:hypothetical protein n=1 Tax=Actinomadura sp. KC06 TaxID=2530369 RepID=UPI00104556C1|nr:hypothetical protein [Actinomadura sp. KC06]TDD35528.1 hypothetical protein E1287_13700 [Actinomadura sp. KC06]